jgi:hypothetical protein
LLAGKDGFLNVFGHGYALNAITRGVDQSLSQLLESGAFTLELRFGRAIVFLLEFTGLESDCAPVGVGHDGRPMAFLNGCYDTCFDPDIQKTPHDPIIFQP